jgi:hypothetical protein
MLALDGKTQNQFWNCWPRLLQKDEKCFVKRSMVLDIYDVSLFAEFRSKVLEYHLGTHGIINKSFED